MGLRATVPNHIPACRSEFFIDLNFWTQNFLKQKFFLEFIFVLDLYQGHTKPEFDTEDQVLFSFCLMNLKSNAA